MQMEGKTHHGAECGLSCKGPHLHTPTLLHLLGRLQPHPPLPVYSPAPATSHPTLPPWLSLHRMWRKDYSGLDTLPSPPPAQGDKCTCMFSFVFVVGWLLQVHGTVFSRSSCAVMVIQEVGNPTQEVRPRDERLGVTAGRKRRNEMLEAQGREL